MQNINLNDKLQTIITASIRGETTGIFKEKLLNLARNSNQTAYELFSEIDLRNNDHRKIFKSILDILKPEMNESTQLLNKYQDWCVHLNISQNLIHFLEFLACNEFYRLMPYIKIIHQLKPYESSWHYYIFTLSLSGLFSLIICFLNQPKLWFSFIKFIKDNAPAILKFLLDYILIAENLAFISFFFNTITFITKFYFILKDHTQTEEAKILELFKLTISSLLVISAQLIFFLGLTPAAYLFVAAALFDVLGSVFTYMSLKKPIKPLEETKFSSFITEDIYYAKWAKYYEEKAHYNLQLKISIYEFIAFFFITVTTVVSIIYFPELSILCVIFQFLCAWLKDMMIEHSKKQNSINLNKQIETIYEQQSSNQESARMAATIASYLWRQKKPKEETTPISHTVTSKS